MLRALLLRGALALRLWLRVDGAIGRPSLSRPAKLSDALRLRPVREVAEDDKASGLSLLLLLLKLKPLALFAAVFVVPHGHVQTNPPEEAAGWAASAAVVVVVVVVVTVETVETVCCCVMDDPLTPAAASFVSSVCDSSSPLPFPPRLVRREE